MAITITKNGDFENVYVKEAICYYARVHEPKKIYKKSPTAKNKSENEYSIILFVDDEDRETLEDKAKLNKQLFKVGKDKNKMRAIKFPTSDQVEEGKPNYDLVKGLNGFQVALPEFTNKGKKSILNVLNAQGEPIEDLIGNGSKVTVKLSGYRNQDGLLNVQPQVVVVLDLVEVEGGDGMVHDDELGFSYSVKRDDDSEQQEEAPKEEEPPFDPNDF